jgi:hypothetical protein
MTLQNERFILEIVKPKRKGYGSKGWAIKATIDGISRYRFYYYKEDALREISEWTISTTSRDFMHNFFSSKELQMEIQKGDDDRQSW